MRKELSSLLNAPVAALFLLLFVSITGVLLWALPGAYNIKEGGYATMEAFFALAPVLLIVLVPALSMKAFSEERKNKTLDLLRTRPLRIEAIVAWKAGAVFCLVVVAFLLSLTSLYVVSYYALPAGNLDGGSILGSYLGLLFFSLSIISLSVFISSLTSSQVLAYIAGVAGCALLYYGFDMLSSLFSGNAAAQISRWGLLSVVLSMKRGVIDTRDLLIIVSYTSLFYMLTCFVVSVRKSYAPLAVCAGLIVSLIVLGNFVHYRWDLTSEKRFTLSKQSEDLLRELQRPLEITSFLGGDLNPGFTRLKQSVSDLADDFRRVSPGKVGFHWVDPHRTADPSAFIRQLGEGGIRGVAVNERDREGGFAQKIVFPWLKVAYDGRSIVIPLLIHHPDKSGEENLNASIENLEYQVITAIYDLYRNQERRIAFLEGNGELSEPEVQDISDRLSRYYSVDRGRISGEKGELDAYEAIVIAGPQTAFSEQEKFVLDQYMMQGGALLLLANGVLLDYQALAEKGETPSMPNPTNLEDMLFHYGLRINPVLIKDLQSLLLQVSVKEDGVNNTLKTVRWPYAPLLNPAAGHPITKNILHVKSEFASTIDFTGKDPAIKKTPLLYTSPHSKVVPVPEMISLASATAELDPKSFDQENLIVAALLEGRFSSVFSHRAIPQGLTGYENILTQSPETRLIVVASEEVIRNDEGQALGYDPYSQITFGNADFLLNAIHYLTDNAQWMQLRNKQWTLRLLDKEKMRATASLPVLFTIVFPAALVLASWLAYGYWRKRRYGEKNEA